MRKLDLDPNVIHWSSEEMSIPYRSPVDGRMHRYFPDFLVERRNLDGTTGRYLIEIKPMHQTVAPVRKSGKKRKTVINEHKTYAVNTAKWDAAEAFCKRNGLTFQILTERELGIK